MNGDIIPFVWECQNVIGAKKIPIQYGITLCEFLKNMLLKIML